MKKRIDIIDALRGLAVVLMVLHHLMFDFVEFLGAPLWLYTNPMLDFLHYVFAGLFIFLSGVSSQFSRSNIKRGLKVFAVAICITIVTYFMDVPIRFGILHLLGFCMVFYGLTRKLWDALPRIIAPVLYLLLLVVTALVTGYSENGFEHIWMLGWYTADFVSYDYFPILPWLFVFLAGTWAGWFIKNEKLPGWFYDTRVKYLPAVGKRALVIYIVHQPVLYGLTMVILLFLKET